MGEEKKEHSIGLYWILLLTIGIIAAILGLVIYFEQVPYYSPAFETVRMYFLIVVSAFLVLVIAKLANRVVLLFLDYIASMRKNIV